MSRLTAIVSVGVVFVSGPAALRAQSRTAYQSIDTIRVDSLMREAPVSSLSELLNSRLLGVHVTQVEGVAGGDVRLQIRAPNSQRANTRPIVIVDGARYVTGWPDSYAGGAGAAAATAPLNDLDPNDVELIEVLKGPSAAALYGSGAADGVVLITTKRGREGRPRWNAHVRHRSMDAPSASWVPGYRAWGHSLFSGEAVPCNVLSHTCVIDSLTISANPFGLVRPTTSPSTWMYGGNVAGGTRALRYYVAANVDGATAFSGVRPFDRAPQIGEYGSSRLNLRANVATPLGRRGELRVHAGYLGGSTDGANGSDDAPVYATASGRTRRLLGSVVGELRLAPWLSARGTLGYDRGRRVNTAFHSTTTQIPDLVVRSGGIDSVVQRLVTADLAASALARAGRVTLRTTLGVEQIWNKFEAMSAVGAGLPPGSTSPWDGGGFAATYTQGRDKVRGVYLDEALALNERLFVTAGVRSERAHRGDDWSDVLWSPHAGASWLVSAEPWMPTLPGRAGVRLRYAFGSVGSGASPARLMPGPVWPVGPPSSSSSRRPERVSEHEYGVDLDGLGGRVQLAFTRYSRRTENQWLRIPVPPTINGPDEVYTPGGSMSQRGIEAQLGLRVLDSRWLNWGVSLQHATSRTEVGGDGDDALFSYERGYVPGYPLGALFRPTVEGYVDQNGDGVLEPAEVQVAGARSYVGETTPPRWQALATTVGIFERHLRLSAMLERRSGYVRQNHWQTELCRLDQCLAAVDPSVGLEAQAMYIAARSSGYVFAESSDFTRLREVSAALDLPRGVARALRGRTLTLTVAARNLALWTDFTGGDPETGHDWRSARSWMLRLDLDL